MSEKHNAEIWAKVHKLEAEIEELKTGIMPAEAVPEVSLVEANAMALAERNESFERQAALDSMLAQALSKPATKRRAEAE